MSFIGRIVSEANSCLNEDGEFPSVFVNCLLAIYDMNRKYVIKLFPDFDPTFAETVNFRNPDFHAQCKKVLIQ